MQMWRDIAAVAFGGAIGSLLRFAVGAGIARAFATAKFPWAILLVNVVGCFLIGSIGEWLFQTKAPEWLRSLLVVGFLGGLTTFSSFGFDTMRQLESAEYGAALANIGASVILGLGAVWLGLIVARQLV